MAQAYWTPDYWHGNWWHGEYFAQQDDAGIPAAQETYAYWAPDYWHGNWWHNNYWAKVPQAAPGFITYLLTWGVGFHQNPEKWPKYQVLHGLNPGVVIIPVVPIVKVYEGWLVTKGPDAVTR